jgi:citrate lyase synthetase
VTGSQIRIREFTGADAGQVFRLLQDTIEASYRGVYTEEGIKLFKDYHSLENIKTDAAAGYAVVAENNGEIIGTGTLTGSNVRRVYISPHNQHRGIGKLIAAELERKAAEENISTLDLSASPVSKRFWESVGYTLQEEKSIPLENNRELRYFYMKKPIK